MMGSCLTAAAPEARSRRGVCKDTATLKSEQLPQRSSRLYSPVVSLFAGGVMQTSDVRSPTLTQTFAIGRDLTVVSQSIKGNLDAAAAPGGSSKSRFLPAEKKSEHNDDGRPYCHGCGLPNGIHRIKASHDHQDAPDNDG